jgi:hypothetical protein
MTKSKTAIIPNKNLTAKWILCVLTRKIVLNKVSRPAVNRIRESQYRWLTKAVTANPTKKTIPSVLNMLVSRMRVCI